MLPDFAQNFNSSRDCITNFSTSRTLINPDILPGDLLRYRQWLLWQYRQYPDRPKPDKCPINAKTLGNAGVGWPNTWHESHRVLWAYRQNPDMAGVGFVLTQHDPYTMIDIDNCLIDDQLSPLASEIVNRLQTYTEISPSSRGLRLFVHCPQQPGPLKRSEIEIYSNLRWATLTGNTLHAAPIAPVADLDWLISRYATHEGKPRNAVTLSPAHRNDLPADDSELWELIFEQDRYGPLHKKRFEGDSSVDSGDRSISLIRLLNCLAHWTKGDAARMVRMIQQSALDQTKWDTRRGVGTYLAYEIGNAIRYRQGGRH